MTTEAQREWQERVETLRNDARLRQQQQGSTLSQFSQAEADIPLGRYAEQGRATVVGSTPTPPYPPGPTWSAADQGVEPALGYAIDDAPVVGEPHEVEQSIQQLGEAGPCAGQAARPRIRHQSSLLHLMS